jgi:hypothetical protein
MAPERSARTALLHGVAYSGVGLPEANMGIALGDVDGNGLFDLFVTHLTEELHRLWLQDESGYFQDRTAQFGLSGARSTGFGTLFGDFDNDGDEDLVVANGMVKRRGNEGPAKTDGQFWTVYAQRNFLLENHDRRFVDVSASTPSFGEQLGVHRVIVTADFDNDGALDLLVTRTDGAARLYRNITDRRNHWITVRLYDRSLRRDVYDSELRVIASGRTWTQWANPGRGFESSVDPRMHLGLGNVEQIDEFSGAVARW